MFVDNYLDGGYHVPYLHKGLDSVLDYNKYTIENGERFCLQSSPMVTRGAETATGAVRRGERALTTGSTQLHDQLVRGRDGYEPRLPRVVHQTEVIFDFSFADVSDAAREFNRASVDIANCVQDEDEGICRSLSAACARAPTNGPVVRASRSRRTPIPPPAARGPELRLRA